MQVDLQLTGQVAVVFGGAAGIGRAIAEEFVREHAEVVLADIAPSTSETATELANQYSARVLGLMIDATDSLAVQHSVDTLYRQFGRCDHVVYAAGLGSGKYGFPFWNLQPADWGPVLQVNLLGAVHVAHAYAPVLAAQQHGTMLFISSVAGQIGSQTDPPYSAAKAALINFVQCAAKDLAPQQVRVNTICPGMIKTALNKSVWQAWHDTQAAEDKLSYDEWASQKIRQLTPLGRWQEPQDIAALAVFLASPRAKNITGQTLNVDGGWVMHW